MTETGYKVSRATVEHLPQLKVLWVANELPAWELEKRLTDFVVVESADGLVQGAVGLEVVGDQGRIYAEAFFDGVEPDQLRPLLWDRILRLAQSMGVSRLWTQERAPFWEKVGMQPVHPHAIQALPEQWRVLFPRWLSYRLAPERLLPESLEKQIVAYMELERARVQRTLRLARLAKTITTVLVFLFFLGCLFLLFWYVLNSPVR